ncbi:unnamed protein product, partial [Amoebophrya sp. A25]
RGRYLLRHHDGLLQAMHHIAFTTKEAASLGVQVNDLLLKDRQIPVLGLDATRTRKVVNSNDVNTVVVGAAPVLGGGAQHSRIRSDDQNTNTSADLTNTAAFFCLALLPSLLLCYALLLYPVSRALELRLLFLCSTGTGATVGEDEQNKGKEQGSGEYSRHDQGRRLGNNAPNVTISNYSV